MATYYDPCKVNVNVAGRRITGYADDGQIKIEPVTKEKVTSKSGVCGDSTWSENKDERVKITLKLLGNSPSNAFLSKLLVGRLPAPVAIENTSSGRYIGGGLDGRVAERPTTEFGKELPDREWVLMVNDWSDIYPDE